MLANDRKLLCCGLMLLLGVGRYCSRRLGGRATSSSHCSRADFNRDVRPILSQHCFKCHGPDDKTREAELRFDIREAALAETGSGVKPIVPGNPEQSELIRRIETHDSELLMPPAAANKPLSDVQKKVLRAWAVAAGG